MKTHKLKTWPPHYKAVANNTKKFELRKNDRGFQTGDILVLREYLPLQRKYTGCQKRFKVTYILHSLEGFPRDELGLKHGYCIMSIRKTK